MLLGAGRAAVADLGITTIADALSACAVTDVTVLDAPSGGDDANVRLTDATRGEAADVHRHRRGARHRRRPSRTRATRSGSPSAAPPSRADAGLGDSISVNGCCLTVADRATATPGPPTSCRRRSTRPSLRASRPGDRVNLERAVTADHAARRPHRPGPRRRRRHRRLAGRPASTGRSSRSRCRPSSAATWSTRARSPSTASRLTVVDVDAPTAFTVSLIPETLARTTLGPQPGDRVNLEVDVIAKHVEKLLAAQATTDADMTSRNTWASASTPSSGAIADIAAGKAVVVVDDEDRENEGDIIFAASKATPELMAFTIRHTSGVICVPMPGDDARPARDPADDAAQQGPAAHGVHDLRRRPRRRHAPASPPPTAPTPPGCWPTRRPSRGRSPGPGHVFPLRYREGGVLVRRGHTEAAVDLARLAGLTPAGVLVEVVNDDGTMKRGARAARVRRRARPGDDLDRGPGRATAAAHEVPGRAGRRDPAADQRTATSRRTATGSPSTTPSTSPWCTATSSGDGEPVLTRVHSECLTGDVFGSEPLRLRPPARRGAWTRSSTEGRGVVVYLRGHEGRGHRPGRQAAGLPAPGRRPRHRRRQPRPRPAGRRPPLRRRDADPRATSASRRCGC